MSHTWNTGDIIDAAHLNQLAQVPDIGTPGTPTGDAIAAVVGTAGGPSSRAAPGSTVGSPAPALQITQNLTATDPTAQDYAPLLVQGAYKATTPSSAYDLAYNGIQSHLEYGQGASNPIGTVQGFTATLPVTSSGHPNNEIANFMGWQRHDNASRVRGWFSDFSIHGPIGAQPSLLNGLTMFIGNYFNGSPSSTPAGGMWIASAPATGGGADAAHLAATTYPVDVGLGVVGFSGTSGASGNGFTTGIQVGGYGSGWMNNTQRSKIGTGVHLQDITSVGLLIDNVQGTATGIKFGTGGTLDWLLDASAVPATSLGGLLLPGTNGPSAGQIKWGTDANAVNLYRSADGILRTDAGTFSVSGTLLMGSVTSDAKLKVVNSAPAVVTMKLRNSGTATVDLVQINNPAGTGVLTRIDKAGRIVTAANAAPATADMADGELAVWADSNGQPNVTTRFGGTAYSAALTSPYGYTFTVDPGIVRGSDALAMDVANRAVYIRVRDYATISKIGLWVGTSSGNISVAAYRNSGTGRNGVPGTLLSSSGAVACPAAGYAEVALGATVTVLPGDWLAISADNVTAAFHAQLANVAANNLALGRIMGQSTAHPLPATPVSLTAFVGFTYVLIGVP